MERSRLNEKTQEFKAKSRQSWSQERLELTQQLINRLEETHANEVLDVGEVAPDFTLGVAGANDRFTLSKALESGPVVVSFYRGEW